MSGPVDDLAAILVEAVRIAGRPGLRWLAVVVTCGLMTVLGWAVAILVTGIGFALTFTFRMEGGLQATWSAAVVAAVGLIAFALAFARLAPLAACVVAARGHGEPAHVGTHALAKLVVLGLPLGAALVDLVLGFLILCEVPWSRSGLVPLQLVRCVAGAVWLLVHARYLGFAAAALADGGGFFETLRAAVEAARARPALSLVPALVPLVVLGAGGAPTFVGLPFFERILGEEAARAVSFLGFFATLGVVLHLGPVLQAAALSVSRRDPAD